MSAVGFAQVSIVGEAGIRQIAIIDQARLFDDSLFGKQTTREFQQKTEVLAQENDTIASAFEKEELELAEARSTLSVEEFRIRAEDFDTRVKASRAAQDQKLRELNQFILEQRARFFEAARPILLQIMQENNIDAILSRDAILLFRDNIDITNQVIAILDERLPIE
ncbi:MAG: OmpH family outer membrane protein [Pseudomonadota bacterium]